MQSSWRTLRDKIDSARFRDVDDFLTIQQKEARWWRDASLQYFQTFARKPVPAGYEAPLHPLEYYLRLRCPPDPRKPRCEAVY
jgi:alpha-glucuronidase